MNTNLSPEQQQALDQSADHLLHVTDPRTSAAYVLIPVEQYETVCEVLDDERTQKAVHAVAMRNAVARASKEL